MSSFTFEDSIAAHKALEFLEMLISVDEVYLNPACRSLLQAVADNETLGHDARDSLGENRIHVDRILTYFRSSESSTSTRSRRTHNNPRPCVACSDKKVKCVLINTTGGQYICERCQKNGCSTSCTPKLDFSTSEHTPTLQGTVKNSASSGRHEHEKLSAYLSPPTGDHSHSSSLVHTYSPAFTQTSDAIPSSLASQNNTFASSSSDSMLNTGLPEGHVPHRTQLAGGAMNHGHLISFSSSSFPHCSAGSHNSNAINDPFGPMSAGPSSSGQDVYYSGYSNSGSTHSAFHDQ